MVLRLLARYDAGLYPAPAAADAGNALIYPKFPVTVSLAQGCVRESSGFDVNFCGTKPFVVVMALLPLLAACEGSTRFGGFDRPMGSQTRVAAQPAPIVAAPTPEVRSEPLPPPPGARVAQGGVSAGPNGTGINDGPITGGVTPGLPDAGTTVPIGPGVGGGVPDTTTPPPLRDVGPRTGTTRIASRDPGPTGPAPAPTRTGVTGNWTARESAGGSCKVTLSSAPALDLYKASSSGCGSRELQRISAWELRGDEVYLYEPGGGVAARLKQSGAQRFEGAAAKTGAPITLGK